MSQKKIYDILDYLGGEATRKEIVAAARQKYPNVTLYKYVSDRLYRLAKWGIVTKTEHDTWKIIKKFDF